MAPYTRQDWTAEYQRLEAGGAPEPCPECGRTGFYGPRRLPDDRVYRACKFCGFWQYEGEDSFVAIPTVHGCGHGSQVLGAPQIWWEVPGNQTFDCPNPACSAGGLRIEDWRVELPNDDPGHPWWKVPQGLSQDEYRAFWANAGWPRKCYF